MLLSPFDVRQGNFAGVLINAVTKTGTNNLHGSGFYYTRNQNQTASRSSSARTAVTVPLFGRRSDHQEPGVLFSGAGMAASEFAGKRSVHWFGRFAGVAGAG